MASLPVAVVIEGVIAGHCDHATPGQVGGIEKLSGSTIPDLKLHEDMITNWR